LWFYFIALASYPHGAYAKGLGIQKDLVFNIHSRTSYPVKNYIYLFLGISSSSPENVSAKRKL
jgi:hypothetical protein